MTSGWGAFLRIVPSEAFQNWSCRLLVRARSWCKNGCHPCLHRKSSRTHRSSPSCYGVDCSGLAPSVYKTLSVPPRVDSLSPRWPPRPGALGSLLSELDLHAGERDVGLRTRSCERTAVISFFSSLWAAHLVDIGFDCAVKAPLLPSRVASFFSLNIKYHLG